MIKASLIRGGTSKGLYINANQLPADRVLRDKVISRIFGSPDRRQIDGIGGADLLTSKCCVMSPPSRPDADIDYHFLQVSIDSHIVSDEINCGNLSPGAAIFAIREGFVKLTEPVTTVRIFNVNLQKILVARVEVKDGEPVVDGNYSIDGVPGTGAEVVMDYSETGGGTTGELLPIPKPRFPVYLETLGAEVEVSLVDIGNLAVFIRAEELGLTGLELPDEAREKAYHHFSCLQQTIAKIVHLKKSDMLPFTCMVSPARDYATFAGTQIKAEDIDFVARLVHGPGEMFGPGIMHKAFPGTLSVATSVISLLPDSVVYNVSKHAQYGLVRIGHPSGRIVVQAEADTVPEFKVTKVIFSRTCRPIMDGYVMVPESFYRTEIEA